MGAVRPTLVIGALLLLAGCAEAGGSAAAPPPDPSAAPSEAPADDAGGTVLLIEQVGGYVTPQHLAARLPLAAVTADGRVFTQGPMIRIFPEPALPNLQVQQVDDDAVRTIVDLAMDAGIGESTDLGTPGITDVPTTRFTLVTDSGTHVREVYALFEATQPATQPAPPEPGTEPAVSGLSPEQAAARAELRGLIEALTDLEGTVGADAVGSTEPYVPEAVAGVVTPWIDLGEELPQPTQPWPGAPLPGEALAGDLGVSCVTSRNEAAQAVLTAAQSANVLTPWASDDGTRWSVLLRPLLPHETGCADLTD